MKKIILILLIFARIESVYASSGRTDNLGCHTSEKEGYHCHGNGSWENVAALLIATGVVYGIGKVVDSFSSKPNDEINTIQTSKDSKSSIKNNLINIEDSMKNIFGIYIGELMNSSTFNKVGNVYEMKNNNNLLGFEKYNVTFKYEKVNSFSANKDVSVRGCQKEKEALKSTLEDNFGNQYKITLSEKSYLLTYPSFISMISCQDDKLTFVLKGK